MIILVFFILSIFVLGLCVGMSIGLLLNNQRLNKKIRKLEDEIIIYKAGYRPEDIHDYSPMFKSD